MTTTAKRELYSSLWQEGDRWFWSVMWVYPDDREEPVDGGIEDTREQAERRIEKATK